MSEKDLWEKDSELLYEKYRQAQDELERCAVLLQQKNEQLAAQALHVQQLEQAQDALTGSRYWRMTAPLRKAVSRVGKMRRRIHDARDRRWVRRTFPGASVPPLQFADAAELRAQLAAPTTDGPLFSILVAVRDTPEPAFRQMVDSVINQTYPRWQLCIADASGDSLARAHQALLARDSRISCCRVADAQTAAECLNAALQLAGGDVLSQIDADALLYPTALYEAAARLRDGSTDAVYTDEAFLYEDGRREPFTKPNFSRDFLYAQNFIGRFLSVRRSVLDSDAPFDPAFGCGTDYDFALRLCARTSAIAHVPRVLYSRPAPPEAGTPAQLRALDACLTRQYGACAFAQKERGGCGYTPRFPLAEPKPKVSIIIPMKDKAELTRICVCSILQKTRYPDYEILLLDNGSELMRTRRILSDLETQSDRVRVCPADFPFNWSRLNNYGADLAQGDVLVFMNNDMEVITEDWLDRLAENALRPDVAVAGPMLLYPDDTVQHAGVEFSQGEFRHSFRLQPAQPDGQGSVLPFCQRGVLALTGACHAVSRTVFETLGRYDEDFVVCWSDIEYCLRARAAGLQVVYIPSVKLYHSESKSRGQYREGERGYIPDGDFVCLERMCEKYKTLLCSTAQSANT